MNHCIIGGNALPDRDTSSVLAQQKFSLAQGFLGRRCVSMSQSRSHEGKGNASAKVTLVSPHVRAHVHV